MKKFVKETLNEFDDAPVRPRVFAIITTLPDEEWQMNEGAYIVVAGSENEAVDIWEKNQKDETGWHEVVDQVIEIDPRGKNFYRLVEPSVM